MTELNPQYRTERDSMGELQVPAAALYGAQTQRAINNFPVSGQSLPQAFIRALIMIKAAAAKAKKAAAAAAKTKKASKEE